MYYSIYYKYYLVIGDKQLDYRAIEQLATAWQQNTRHSHICFRRRFYPTTASIVCRGLVVQKTPRVTQS